MTRSTQQRAVVITVLDHLEARSCRASYLAEAWTWIHGSFRSVTKSNEVFRLRVVLYKPHDSLEDLAKSTTADGHLPKPLCLYISWTIKI
jgi:hypothetical protein